MDLYEVNNERIRILNEKNNLIKRIEAYELEINANSHRSKEDNEKIIALEVDKRNLQYKNKSFEIKVNSLLKELEELRNKNNNLNLEISQIRNDKNSNLDNSSEENKKKSYMNNGINLNTFLDEQYTKQNSNILNMREIFRTCNTLKKKFSQKQTTLNPQKFLKTLTRDNSTGSKNSNISARVVENKNKNSSSEVNGFARSHIPFPPRKIDNIRRCKNKNIKIFIEK